MINENISIFRAIFKGRVDVYGLAEGKSVKQPLSDAIISGHLESGVNHIGIYPLLPDNTSHFIVVDIDTSDISDTKKVYEVSLRNGIPCSVEKSKSKGFHIWVFFEEAIAAKKSRLVLNSLIKEAVEDKTFEVFPKQDSVSKGGYGNYINLPLYQPLTKEGRTVFINMDNGQEPFEDQWEFLSKVEKITERQLDEIIEKRGLMEPDIKVKAAQAGSGDENFGLPCINRILEGADDGSRDEAAFLLAKYYRDASLPKEKTLEILNDWDKKNKPCLGSTVITTKVKQAFKGFKGFACNNAVLKRYCSPECWRYKGSNNNVSVGDLKEITPTQDFKDGKAYVTVPIRQVRDGKLFTTQHMISSDRKKMELNAGNLLSMKYYSQRSPSSSDRWSDKSREAYLNGDFKVDIAGCYTQIRDLFGHYIAFEDARWYEVMACWVIGTYFHRMFSSYPYIHLNGVFRTGKTKTLTLASCLAFNGRLTFQCTPSCVIRNIHDNHATCCIDEAEKLNTSHDQENQVVVSMFNAGYKKGAFCGKSEQAGNGEKWVSVELEAFSPKMFASIKEFESSLASRCIPVTMVRTGDKEILNREINVQDSVFQELRDKLYPIALTYHTEVEQTYKESHDNEILGREWELWRPILSIAKVIDKHAGEESKLYDKLRCFALEVLEAKKGAMAEDNTAPIMLQVLADYIRGHGSEDGFYSVGDLIGTFKDSQDEIFNWLSDKSCHRPGRWLGNELRKLGIVKGKAAQRKRNGQNEKGYMLKLEDVEKMLRNYEL